MRIWEEAIEAKSSAAHIYRQHLDRYTKDVVDDTVERVTRTLRQSGQIESHPNALRLLVEVGAEVGTITAQSMLDAFERPESPILVVEPNIVDLVTEYGQQIDISHPFPESDLIAPFGIVLYRNPESLSSVYKSEERMLRAADEAQFWGSGPRSSEDDVIREALLAAQDGGIAWATFRASDFPDEPMTTFLCLASVITSSAYGSRRAVAAAPFATPLATGVTADEGQGKQRHTYEYMYRFFRALMSFQRQEVTARRSVQPTRAERRRHNLAAEHPLCRHGVQVVTLRRTAQRGLERSAPEDVEWAHHWLVRGHVRMWKFKDGVVRDVWVRPHVKGDLSKPFLQHQATIYDVAR